ncbi:MAG: hypothetical protein V1725_00805 [archaeon]
MHSLEDVCAQKLSKNDAAFIRDGITALAGYGMYGCLFMKACESNATHDVRTGIMPYIGDVIFTLPNLTAGIFGFSLYQAGKKLKSKAIQYVGRHLPEITSLALAVYVTLYETGVSFVQRATEVLPLPYANTPDIRDISLPLIAIGLSYIASRKTFNMLRNAFETAATTTAVPGSSSRLSRD